MQEVVEAMGEREGDMSERGGSGRLSFCLTVLAALNLAVMMVVTTQLPVTSPGLERLVQQGAGGEETHLVRGSGAASYAFSSCAGGGSVNCHRNGNLAGL